MKILKNAIKYLIAYTAKLTLYTHVAECYRKKRYRNYIRIVSYHDTPPSATTAFRKQLRYFSKHYHPATWKDVEALVRGEEWPYKKPGILFSFDDGAATNYTVAAPMLEEYGFSGVFLIVPDGIDSPIEQQDEYAKQNEIFVSKAYAKSPQLFVSWCQVSDLIERGHSIASHTKTHHRFSEEDTPDVIEDQVVKSKNIITQKVGQPVDMFSWAGGELWVYQKPVYQAILEADYRYTLTTCAMPITSGTDPHLIGRTALSCKWPVSLIRLTLLPWYDEKYRQKENLIRVNFGLEKRGKLNA